MAAFVHRYYRRTGVGVDDLGAMAWFSDGKKFDLTLSENAHRADSLCRSNGIRAAIVSDPRFDPIPFPRWQPIASWKIPASSHSAGATFKFYSLNEYDTMWMRKNLKDYQTLLPANIEVRYY